MARNQPGRCDSFSARVRHLLNRAATVMTVTPVCVMGFSDMSIRALAGKLGEDGRRRVGPVFGGLDACLDSGVFGEHVEQVGTVE